MFTTDLTLARVEKDGDLWESLITMKQKLPKLEVLQALTSGVSAAPKATAASGASKPTAAAAKTAPAKAKAKTKSSKKKVAVKA